MIRDKREEENQIVSNSWNWLSSPRGYVRTAFVLHSDGGWNSIDGSVYKGLRPMRLINV